MKQNKQLARYISYPQSKFGVVFLTLILSGCSPASSAQKNDYANTVADTSIRHAERTIASQTNATVTYSSGLRQAKTATVSEATPQMNLLRTQLRIRQARANVQVASTADSREVGLMYRRSLANNEGMLFVFEAPNIQCFWMRNTYIPLTAAFIDSHYQIITISDMQPLTEQSHCSTQPAQYVLEMPQGWFKQQHINIGDKVDINAATLKAITVNN